MISVIIPFYNSENYLKNCINCLLNQTFQNFEAIFVNDGSTDNYKKIFDSISDSRIKLIEQTNSGVSSARNYGINNSNGDYICFLDVDDLYHKDYLEIMYHNMLNSDADCVLCNYNEVYRNKSIPIVYKWSDYKMEQEEIRKTFIPCLLGSINKKDRVETVRGLVWRTMIKKKVLKINNIKFDSNVMIAEDLLFLLYVYSSCNNIYFSKDILYDYNRYFNTTLSKYHENMLVKEIYLHNEFIRFLKEKKLYNINETRYKSNRMRMYTSLLSNSVRNKSFLKKYQEIKYIAKYFSRDEYIKNVYSKLDFLYQLSYLLLKLKFIIVIIILYSFKVYMQNYKLSKEV